jgi:hypothetical protein
LEEGDATSRQGFVVLIDMDYINSNGVFARCSGCKELNIMFCLLVGLKQFNEPVLEILHRGAAALVHSFGTIGEL